MVPRGGLEPPTHGFSVAANPTSISADVVTDFLADRQGRALSPATLTFYEKYLRGFIKHTGLPLLILTKQDVQRGLAALSCSLGGKHAYLRSLRAFYSWAEDYGLIERNPCYRLTLRVPKPLRPAVALGDIPKLLDAGLRLKDRLIVALLADTGLRRLELATVRRGDIDPDSQTIRVWGKGAKQRVVRYGPHSARLLAAYLAESEPSETLLNMKASGITTMLRRLGKATGITCNAHAFRRTFACESVRNGMNLFHVQSLLGHSTLAMTRVYAEQVNSEDAIKAYKPIMA